MFIEIYVIKYDATVEQLCLIKYSHINIIYLYNSFPAESWLDSHGCVITYWCIPLWLAARQIQQFSSSLGPCYVHEIDTIIYYTTPNPIQYNIEGLKYIELT